MSVGRRVTSCLNSYFSCTPNWSKVFETNISGQQNLCESLFLEEIFTNGTKALTGKRVKHVINLRLDSHSFAMAAVLLLQL